MTQYLPSVHMIEGAEPPPQEVMETMYCNVDAVDGEIKAAGVGVALRLLRTLAASLARP